MTAAQKPEPSPFAAELGAALRAVRKRHGLSLAATEAQPGSTWTAVAVGSYERGERMPTCERLAELCHFYDVTVAEVWPGQKWPRADPRAMRLADEAIAAAEAVAYALRNPKASVRRAS